MNISYPNWIAETLYETLTFAVGEKRTTPLLLNGHHLAIADNDIHQQDHHANAPSPHTHTHTGTLVVATLVFACNDWLVNYCLLAFSYFIDVRSPLLLRATCANEVFTNANSLNSIPSTYLTSPPQQANTVWQSHRKVNIKTTIILLVLPLFACRMTHTHTHK